MTTDHQITNPWEALAARLRWALQRRHPPGDPRRDLALFVAAEVARRAGRSRGAQVTSLALWWPTASLDDVGGQVCLALAEVRWGDGGARGGRYWLLGQAEASARVVARREGDERRAFQALELEPALVPLIHEALDRLQMDADDDAPGLRRPA
ncbi:MAG: hypothetical protein KF878_36790 [Planctomycetes bacterium]|nr:hypothetical protein [Planctomycetota bacterium]